MVFVIGTPSRRLLFYIGPQVQKSKGLITWYVFFIFYRDLISKFVLEIIDEIASTVSAPILMVEPVVH